MRLNFRDLRVEFKSLVFEFGNSEGMCFLVCRASALGFKFEVEGLGFIYLGV